MYYNSRNYQVPFEFYKLKKTIIDGMETSVFENPIIVFGSITINNPINGDENFDAEFPSILIKTPKGIDYDIDDRVVVKLHRYIIYSVTDSLYNNGEVLIRAKFEEKVEDSNLPNNVEEQFRLIKIQLKFLNDKIDKLEVDTNDKFEARIGEITNEIAKLSANLSDLQNDFDTLDVKALLALKESVFEIRDGLDLLQKNLVTRFEEIQTKFSNIELKLPQHEKSIIALNKLTLENQNNIYSLTQNFKTISDSFEALKQFVDGFDVRINTLDTNIHEIEFKNQNQDIAIKNLDLKIDNVNSGNGVNNQAIVDLNNKVSMLDTNIASQVVSINKNKLDIIDLNNSLVATNNVLKKTIEDLKNANFSNYRGEWIASTTYNVGDIVNFNRKFYISTINNNVNKNPQTNINEWNLLNFFVDDTKLATKDELKIVDNKANNNQTSIATLQQTTNSLQTNIDEITRYIPTLNTQVITNKTNIETHETKFTTMNSKIDANVGFIGDIKNQMTTMNQVLNDITTRIDSNQTNITSHNTQIIANTNKISTLETTQNSLITKTQHINFDTNLDSVIFDKNIDFQNTITINNIPTPTSPTMITNKQFVETSIGDKVNPINSLLKQGGWVRGFNGQWNIKKTNFTFTNGFPLINRGSVLCKLVFSMSGQRNEHIFWLNESTSAIVYNGRAPFSLGSLEGFIAHGRPLTNANNKFFDFMITRNTNNFFMKIDGENAPDVTWNVELLYKVYGGY